MVRLNVRQPWYSEVSPGLGVRALGVPDLRWSTQGAPEFPKSPYTPQIKGPFQGVNRRAHPASHSSKFKCLC
jgi:hypothetical protein